MEIHVGFFDDEKNVQDYIQMADGYDGEELIGIMRSYVPKGARVLELGMGSGKDLEILKRYYAVTGSDSSEVFLNMYASTHTDADLLRLDAVTLNSDRSFDCIYSNKVLMHLTKEQLGQSLSRQRAILNEGGIIFHSFWEGDRVENMKDLLFFYYKKNELARIVGLHFDVLGIEIYTEIERDDSLYVAARKR
jgi:trans-aconitate methyltransferase